MPGLHFAGTVAEVAAGVKAFKPGQRVFGIKGFRGGAHVEFLTILATGTILSLLDSLSFEEGAAFFFGGLTAANFLTDKANMRPGESPLVIGATGAVGSASVSLGLHLGLHVTSGGVDAEPRARAEARGARGDRLPGRRAPRDI